MVVVVVVLVNMLLLLLLLVMVVVVVVQDITAGWGNGFSIPAGTRILCYSPNCCSRLRSASVFLFSAYGRSFPGGKKAGT
jgi:hypothetical protein